MVQLPELSRTVLFLEMVKEILVSGKALAAGTFGNEPTASALSLTTLECGFETGA